MFAWLISRYDNFFLPHNLWEIAGVAPAERDIKRTGTADLICSGGLVFAWGISVI